MARMAAEGRRLVRQTGAMGDAIAIRHNAERERFEADLGDASLAIAEYRLRPGKILFTHTEVPAKHEGKGIGSALVRFGLKWARDHGLEVIPACPFFAAYMKKHAEVQDLLDAAWRAKLGIDQATPPAAG